jgi:hypothetical protein
MGLLPIFILASGINIIANAGTWNIGLSRDQMSDEITCTAFHKKGANTLQFDYYRFLIGIPRFSIAEAISLRFDERPALPLSLILRDEARTGVYINRINYEEFLESRRLRFRLVGSSGFSHDGDFELNGQKKALSLMTTKPCPSPPS